MHIRRSCAQAGILCTVQNAVEPIQSFNFFNRISKPIEKVERQIGYYLIYGLLPSMICVVMSWAGFWIKLTVPPARVGLCITTYLSLKTLGQVRFDQKLILDNVENFNLKWSWNVWKSFIRDIPKVPYIKIIDVWMFACESSVFMTLIEFTMAQVWWLTLLFIEYLIQLGPF